MGGEGGKEKRENKLYPSPFFRSFSGQKKGGEKDLVIEEGGKGKKSEASAKKNSLTRKAERLPRKGESGGHVSWRKKGGNGGQSPDKGGGGGKGKAYSAFSPRAPRIGRKQ